MDCEYTAVIDSFNHNDSSTNDASLCDPREYFCSMFRIGSHVSISDGLPAAVERAVDLGGNCGQIFVGSPQGWAVSEIEEETAADFRDATTEHDVAPWIVHGTYLINLATPDEVVFR